MGRIEYLDFLHNLDKCSIELEEDVNLLFWSFDVKEKNATRDGLLRAFPRLVERDSRMAGKLAKDYYLSERMVVSAEVYPAFIAEAADRSDIEESVRYACGHLYEGGRLRMDAKMACDQLVASADRMMRERAFGTIVQNAINDPLRPKCKRYAESTACEFCRGKAGSAFVSPMDVSTSLHEFCKCSVDVDFDGSKQNEDEKFALSVVRSTNTISEYEKRYVTREVNGLWRKYQHEEHGIIYIGDYGYAFDIDDFDSYRFRWKRGID